MPPSPPLRIRPQSSARAGKWMLPYMRVGRHAPRASTLLLRFRHPCWLVFTPLSPWPSLCLSLCPSLFHPSLRPAFRRTLHPVLRPPLPTPPSASTPSQRPPLWPATLALPFPSSTGGDKTYLPSVFPPFSLNQLVKDSYLHSVPFHSLPVTLPPS